MNVLVKVEGSFIGHYLVSEPGKTSLSSASGMEADFQTTQTPSTSMTYKV